MSGHHEQHFGIWAHAHNGTRVAAYARFSEHHGGYVVYAAASGRRLSGDRAFRSLGELSRANPEFSLDPAAPTTTVKRDLSGLPAADRQKELGA